MTKIFNFQFLIFNSKRRNRGFTLIELLIVIVIIGILSSFLLANYIGIRQRARDGVRKSDLRQIQSALELYRSDKGVYPTVPSLTCGCALTSGAVTTGGIDCSTSSPAGVVYMKKIPCDPATAETYKYSSTGSTYALATCLENVNDSQRDSTNNPPTGSSNCAGGASNWSYTLYNP